MVLKVTTFEIVLLSSMYKYQDSFAFSLKSIFFVKHFTVLKSVAIIPSLKKCAANLGKKFEMYLQYVRFNISPLFNHAKLNGYILLKVLKCYFLTMSSICVCIIDSDYKYIYVKSLLIDFYEPAYTLQDLFHYILNGVYPHHKIIEAVKCRNLNVDYDTCFKS